MFVLLTTHMLMASASGATCGSFNGKIMSVNKIDKYEMDEQVHNLAGSWETGCNACGEYLESTGQLCRGWYCVNYYGMWLKRSKSTPCPETTQEPSAECASIEIDDCQYSTPEKDTAESTTLNWDYNNDNCIGVVENKISNTQSYKQTATTEQSYKLTNSIQKSVQAKLGVTVAAEVSVKFAVSAKISSKVTSEVKTTETVKATAESFTKKVETKVAESTAAVNLVIPPKYNTTFVTTATRVTYKSPFSCVATCFDAAGEEIGTTLVYGTAAGQTFENVDTTFKQEYCGPCLSDGDACLRNECDHQCASATCGTGSSDHKGWYCFTDSGDKIDLCRCGAPEEEEEPAPGLLPGLLPAEMGTTTYVILAAVVVILVLVLAALIAACVYCCCCKKTQTHNRRTHNLQGISMPPAPQTSTAM